VLKLDDAGLVATTPKAEARFAITSVQRVVDTPEYVFIYLGAMQAFIIPRGRVVRGDVDIFVRQLQERVGGTAVSFLGVSPPSSI
jgi:hypothetical protein